MLDFESTNTEPGTVILALPEAFSTPVPIGSSKRIDLVTLITTDDWPERVSLPVTVSVTV